MNYLRNETIKQIDERLRRLEAEREHQIALSRMPQRKTVRKSCTLPQDVAEAFDDWCKQQGVPLSNGIAYALKVVLSREKTPCE